VLAACRVGWAYAAEATAAAAAAAGKTYVIVHVCGAQQEDAVVVRELGAVDVGAVFLHMAAVVDAVVVVDELDAHHPVPCVIGPLGIGLVAGVTRESCAEVEEDAVGDAYCC
jgi:hypothetical protein